MDKQNQQASVQHNELLYAQQLQQQKQPMNNAKTQPSASVVIDGDEDDAVNTDEIVYTQPNIVPNISPVVQTSVHKSRVKKPNTVVVQESRTVKSSTVTTTLAQARPTTNISRENTQSSTIIPSVGIGNATNQQTPTGFAPPSRSNYRPQPSARNANNTALFTPVPIHPATSTSHALVTDCSMVVKRGYEYFWKVTTEGTGHNKRAIFSLALINPPAQDNRTTPCPIHYIISGMMIAYSNSWPEVQVTLLVSQYCLELDATARKGHLRPELLVPKPEKHVYSKELFFLRWENFRDIDSSDSFNHLKVTHGERSWQKWIRAINYVKPPSGSGLQLILAEHGLAEFPVVDNPEMEVQPAQVQAVVEDHRPSKRNRNQLDEVVENESPAKRTRSDTPQFESAPRLPSPSVSPAPSVQLQQTQRSIFNTQVSNSSLLDTSEEDSAYMDHLRDRLIMYIQNESHELKDLLHFKSYFASYEKKKKEKKQNDDN